MIKTKNKLLENIQNPNIFFDILLSIPKDTYLEKIIILVKQEQELDYFFLASQALKNDYEPFKLQLILDKLVSVSILNTDIILLLYKELTSLHYEFITLKMSEKITEVSKEFTLELYKTMTKDTKEFMSAHISILFLALYENKNPYKKIQKLFEKENIFLTLSVIEIISFIKLSKREIKDVYETFDKLKKLNNTDLGNAILKTSAKLNCKYIAIK